jgi:hypothetical protein
MSTKQRQSRPRYSPHAVKVAQLSRPTITGRELRLSLSGYCEKLDAAALRSLEAL